MSDEEKNLPKASAGRVKWLLGELEGWVAEGLIGREAADKISDRYKKAAAGRGRAALVYVMGIFAALLLGLGVIMFFASNWDGIPRYGKLAIICITIAASYYAGYELKYKRRFDIIGEAMVLLGSILFGSGIYLVAQAFDIKAHFPNGVLLWTLGLVPLLLLTKSKPILVEVILLFCTWIIWEAVALPNRPPVGAYHALTLRCVFGLLIFAGLSKLVYKYRTAAGAALIVPAALIWLSVFLFGTRVLADEHQMAYLLILYLAFFIALGALGAVHELLKNLPSFGGIYRTYAALGIAALLYIFTFPELVDEISKNGTTALGAAITFLFIACPVAAYVFIQARREGDIRPGIQGQIYLLFGLCLATILIFLVLPGAGSQGLVGFLANLILFGYIIALIFLGYRGGYAALINLGIFFFAVDLITRYFDFFWDLMPRSLFFMIGGVVLLVGGIFMEKNRRKWVIEAKEASQ